MWIILYFYMFTYHWASNGENRSRMKWLLLIGCLFTSAIIYGCLFDETATYAYRIGEQGNPDGQPTWENSIGQIMYNKCAECHERDVASYEAILPWVESGELKEYTEAEHYIEGLDKVRTLFWLEIGAPETDEDVAEE